MTYIFVCFSYCYCFHLKCIQYLVLMYPDKLSITEYLLWTYEYKDAEMWSVLYLIIYFDFSANILEHLLSEFLLRVSMGLLLQAFNIHENSN